MWRETYTELWLLAMLGAACGAPRVAPSTTGDVPSGLTLDGATIASVAGERRALAVATDRR
jgi:hypothetical protein